MAKVQVEVLSAFAEALGMPKASEELIPDPGEGHDQTVRDVVERLAAKYRYFGEEAFDHNTHALTGMVAIFHNGSALDLSGGLETVLKDGDILTFVPVIAGG